MNDKQRLETLKRGLVTAGENGFVAIAAKDLRWLIEQVELEVGRPAYETFVEPEKETTE